MSTTVMSPSEARVALRTVLHDLRALALRHEIDNEHARADFVAGDADLIAQALDAWEAQQGGF